MDEGQTKRKLVRAALRWIPRLLVLLVAVGALYWFFIVRTSDSPATTSAEKKTTVSATSNKPKTETTTEAKSTTPAPNSTSSDLPNTGPADTLALVGAAIVVGTLAWELRLRYAHIRRR